MRKKHTFPCKLAKIDWVSHSNLRKYCIKKKLKMVDVIKEAITEYFRFLDRQETQKLTDELFQSKK